MNSSVEQHYSRPHLYEKIIDTLEKTGVDKNRVSTKELATVDEFHVRGLEVTKELAQRLGLEEAMKVLDVGCGIGGPARLMAEDYGCDVTGIDITNEFIRTATLLSELTGLHEHTYFIQADATALPFDDESFDIAWTQHVQMNIEDKRSFYSEIARVLKRGGRFIYYDIFCTEIKPVHFPVPWSDFPSLSYLVTKEEVHTFLHEAAMDIVETADQTAAGIKFFQAMLEKARESGMPPVSLQLVMGEDATEKLGNVYRNLSEKRILLESGICRKI
jgi:ubiquinone/menaquinone biosynthesis C-methylase UbiE